MQHSLLRHPQPHRIALVKHVWFDVSNLLVPNIRPVALSISREPLPVTRLDEMESDGVGHDYLLIKPRPVVALRRDHRSRLYETTPRAVSHQRIENLTPLDQLLIRRRVTDSEVRI